MDHFYVGKKFMKADAKGVYDFDAPESVNIEECAKAVQSLSEGKKTTIPFYDMKLSERTGTQDIQVNPHHRFIVVEGLFSFYEPLGSLASFKVFLDTPREIRVARRMLRDQSKGRSDIETLAWSIVVEKNHAKYVEPMKQAADIIIPFSYNPVSFS
ncbi:MAG: Uridine kinase [Candidatus Shapirobacteria bacterium GW2011_GWE1_38_10]|uniref:Uridine kinase n=1 Tax=Candidatus Shapirobacteria bacterium GW2011_GWE1_38_10 TaxID=1618488 RepID=A0A0G0I801_9BACT|nr:MAG: Uridine kinase [Candidatus Shapirobacteria bacterium GW2011_GWF2_37_20]KKQ50642.1 MAG: Uridine kinase [Candidatus Shapirobacteria bacterium GW2011_GWE1_38_10]